MKVSFFLQFQATAKSAANFNNQFWTSFTIFFCNSKYTSSIDFFQYSFSKMACQILLLIEVSFIFLFWKKTLWTIFVFIIRKKAWYSCFSLVTLCHYYTMVISVNEHCEVQMLLISIFLLWQFFTKGYLKKLLLE